MNARRQVTVEERGIDNEQGTGPAVTTTYDYWPASGRMKAISGVSASGFDVQDLRYTWDQLGNLEKREEYSGSKALTETFTYDGLNRLTQASVAGQGTVTVTYDSYHLGNIASKSDVGSYAYTSSCPHAVTSAGGASYSYDANGNNISGDGRTLAYTTFDKPYEISKGGHTVSFAYGPDRARYRRIDTGTDGTTTTRYIASVEIIFHPDGTQERKRYLAGVAIESRTVTGGVEGGRTTHYVHKDHLGSLDVLTDVSGTVVQELSFDAWGKRRDATDWTALSAGALLGFDHSLTTRGYTGHEMLDEVGLIHMNGRVYDPKLARFLQADPFIQDPTNSQSLNRYSYVWNNPLNATDPSGYFVFTLIATAIVAADIGLKIHAVVALFAVAGFADTLLAGGSFKDALLAGISAGAFAALGAHLGGFTGFGDAVGDVMAMGVLGGVTTVLQGGKFGHGFRSAGLGSLTGGIAGRITRNMGRFAQGVARMVAVGTTSDLTGGKFANGAAFAAFSFAASSAGQALADRDLETMSEAQRVNESATDESYKTTIELRHNRIVPWLGPFSPNHAYIIVTDHDTGIQMVYRAGPEKNILRDGTFGTIDARFEQYVEGAVDWTIEPAKSVVVLQSAVPANSYNNTLQQFVRHIDAADIPYKLLSQNSNTFAYQGFTPASQTELAY